MDIALTFISDRNLAKGHFTSNNPTSTLLVKFRADEVMEKVNILS